MRILQGMAALSLAGLSIWHIPVLSGITPQAVLQNVGYDRCGDARRLLRSDAAWLGYASVRWKCKSAATFDGLTARRPARSAEVLDYNDFDRINGTPPIETGFEVPENIPFAAATSTIVSHVPIDDLFVSLRVDDALAAAFALENAGVSRKDMTSTGTINNFLVRLRPFSEERARRIVDIVERSQRFRTPVDYFEIGFIRDCTAAHESLSATALQDAHRRALVMARAAGIGLGPLLGIVDAGGTVIDAVCGSGAEPSMHEAAGLVQPSVTGTGVNRVDMTIFGEATVIRRLSAAWRLTLPPNAHGVSYEYGRSENPFSHQRRASLPFVANGLASEGDVMVLDSLRADIVSIQVPDQAFAILKNSAYASNLTYVGPGVGLLAPAIMLKAGSTAALKRNIQSVQSFVSNSTHAANATAGWRYAFASGNCHSPIDGALYDATRSALAKLGRKRIRYLEQLDVTTTNIACTIVPPANEINPVETWSPSSDPPGSAVTASVIAGY